MKYSQFPTTISFSNQHDTTLPEQYGFQDVRYTKDFAQYIIERFSSPGDTILDPFAGFGTTLLVGKQLGRQVFGVEIDDEKVKYMKTDLKFGKELIHGDIKRLFLDRLFPPIDLIFTSPPYMGQEDGANALTGYRYAGKYENYLDELQGIMQQLVTLLSDDGLLILEIANLQQTQSRTTLAWDVGKKISEIAVFEGEIIVNWTGDRDNKGNGLYNYGYDHSYCLVYSKSVL